MADFWPLPLPLQKGLVGSDSLLPVTKPEDQSGGDPSIILRVVCELSAKVVQLNQSHPDVLRSLDIESTTERHTKRILREFPGCPNRHGARS